MTVSSYGAASLFGITETTLDKPSNDINTTWNKKYNTAKKKKIHSSVKAHSHGWMRQYYKFITHTFFRDFCPSQIKTHKRTRTNNLIMNDSTHKKWTIRKTDGACNSMDWEYDGLNSGRSV